jgi:hypothetical protein
MSLAASEFARRLTIDRSSKSNHCQTAVLALMAPFPAVMANSHSTAPNLMVPGGHLTLSFCFNLTFAEPSIPTQCAQSLNQQKPVLAPKKGVFAR